MTWLGEYMYRIWPMLTQVEMPNVIRRPTRIRHVTHSLGTAARHCSIPLLNTIDMTALDSSLDIELRPTST
ncbi:hypothetical protein IEQ34_012117 [Dendrobium chrysotoxum]|uniref:Uncharacterized protein n=1 Tax=Dendrobium chrysotoxum TaxID=161865 RepID=A0AAV7GUI9_DENCH|nr:hypothetical protein IEQ34_012117 [Dendrobium chrysotoxum]